MYWLSKSWNQVYDRTEKITSDNGWHVVKTPVRNIGNWNRKAILKKEKECKNRNWRLTKLFYADTV